MDSLNLDFLFGNEPVDLDSFFKAVYEKNIHFSHIAISARVLHHWKKFGLMTQEMERKVNRLSFKEYIWLSLLDEAREFGMPLEKLLRVKEKLLTRISLPEFSQYFTFSVSIGAKAEASHFKVRGESLLKEMDQLSKEGSELFCDYLDILLLVSLIGKYYCGIVVDRSGETEIWMATGKAELSYKQAHLYIPLQPLFINFLSSDVKPEYIEPLNLLTENELEVLTHLRKKDVKELRIKFNSSDSYLMEVDKAGSLTEEQTKKLMEVLSMGSYEDVTFTTHKGKTVTFKKTVKHKV